MHLMRRCRGLTLKDLAAQAGTSFATVSRMERGTKPQVSLDVASRVATVLGVSLDWLVGRQCSAAEALEFLSTSLLARSAGTSNAERRCLTLNDFAARTAG